MSVFQTARPDSAEMRYQKALETAIARKNNRRQITENHIIEKQQAETQAMLESFDQNTNNENPYTSRRQAQRAAYETNRALMSLNQRLVTEGYQKCFNVAISDIVYEGFWADDNVKQKTVQDIKATCESVLSTLSELGIQPVSEMKENQFVKNLKEVVMEACKKTADRITKEAQDNKDCCSKDDIDSISFDMTDSEINDLDNNLSELSPEDIASLVKSKVLQVIQDERECGKRKSEAFKDIDDSVKQMEEEDDDMDDDDNEDDNVDDDNEPSEESITFESALLAAKKRKINRHLGDSVFECIMMGSTKDVQEHVQYAAMESVDTMSIMDAAFMETVLKYTVLETVQTMGLYNFDHSDIKKICNHYMK